MSTNILSNSIVNSCVVPGEGVVPRVTGANGVRSSNEIFFFFFFLRLLFSSLLRNTEKV